MITMRTFPALFLLTLISSCSVVGNYEFEADFFGESLELRSNHTFSYSCGSDEMGDDYSATGGWVQKGSTRVVTTVVSATGPANCLTPVQGWRLTGQGIKADGRRNLLNKK
jgi:hypothetical protein